MKHLSSTRTPFARTLPMLECCCADGRAYVSFGKLLVRQRRFGEAEQLYQDGCRMTENINPHIWQVGPMPDADAQLDSHRTLIWQAVSAGDQPYPREAGLPCAPVAQLVDIMASQQTVHIAAPRRLLRQYLPPQNYHRTPQQLLTVCHQAGVPEHTVIR